MFNKSLVFVDINVLNALYCILESQRPDSGEETTLCQPCVDIAGYKIINVYKPPSSWPTQTDIPTFTHPSLYAGDFNRQHINWGYNKTSTDGESLDSWATSNNHGLLYNPEETASFLSHRSWLAQSCWEAFFAQWGFPIE